MDFTVSSEATDAAALAKQILTDHCTPERLHEVDTTGDRFDERLWYALGEAGLLGLAVPEQYGGAGLGLLELAAVLVEAGRTVAPAPLVNHLAGTLAVAEFGADELRSRWLPRAATGEVLVTAGIHQDRSGTVGVVPAAGRADLLVLSTPEGLLACEPQQVEVQPQRLTDGAMAGQVTPGGGDVLGGQDAVGWLSERLDLLEVAHLHGVVDGAVKLTAAYARAREQFGRPIGSFQAVGQRLADGYIDDLGSQLTLWQAAWRLSESLPAEVEMAIAKLWAADAAHRVAHTAVHVHGGVGIDLDGEAHRYFTAAKRGEMLLGGTTQQARAIGAVLAAG